MKQTSLKAVFSLGLAIAALGFPLLPARAQTLTEKILAMETGLEQEFEDYFGADLAEVTQTPADIAATLARIGAETNTTPAVLWAIPRGDHLHLVLITPGGKPIVRDLYDVSDETLRNTVKAFHREIHNPPDATPLRASQQLYTWMVEPFEAEYLEAEGVDTILFCLGNGLRSLPLAALYDGEQFLLEKYSLTRIPAFNLIETDYVNLQGGQFLAMGASEFESKNPLPAVPIELANMRRELQVVRPPEQQWDGKSYLNQGFTLTNFQRSLNRTPPQIVHLATHAIFDGDDPQQSYIQLWDSQLNLSDFDEMNWNRPPLELLVLSACRTAVGNDRAELGFAGLALQAGVKSAIASLWNVSDAGTLVLMSEFYQQLGRTTTKAEALRQAQLAMLRGEARIEGDRLILSEDSIPLPAALQTTAARDLSAPFYWAGFTMISSPW
jgi:CHAT domain-containing protein